MRKLVLLFAITFYNSTAQSQIVLSRAQIGFEDSRHYFTGFTGNGFDDSLKVGVPSDSGQAFDFSSIYYVFTCSSSWAEDTNISIENKRFENSNELQLEVKPWDSPSTPDSVINYYSTGLDVSNDTMFYYGQQDLTYLSDSIVLTRPLPLFIFPLHLGDHWSDTTLASVGSDVTPISIVGNVDAYGTLSLPTGSYESLRVRVYINYGSYANYCYYYFTDSPFVSATIVALKSSDPGNDKQFIFRASYTGPIEKYNHTVGPIVNVRLEKDTATAQVGGFDSVDLICVNTGDTTAELSSISFSPPSSQFSVPSSFVSATITAHDSSVIPIVFHPSKKGISSTIIFISATALNGSEEGIGLYGEALAASGVDEVSNDLPAMNVYPDPAMNNITIASSTNSFSIVDPLGRSYEVKQSGNSLDVSSLPPGMYFISDGHSQTKFVKE